MKANEVERARRLVNEARKRRRLAEEAEIEAVVRACVRAAGKSARRGVKITSVSLENMPIKHLRRGSWIRVFDILLAAGYKISTTDYGSDIDVYYDAKKDRYIRRRELKYNYDYFQIKEFYKTMESHLGLKSYSAGFDISL